MFYDGRLTWPDTAPISKGFAMFYVICPTCQARVEIPADAVGPDRSDSWNVVRCDECNTGFDYDDDDVFAEDQSGD